MMIVNFVDTHIRELPQIEQIGLQLYDLVDARGHRKLILDFDKVQSLSSQALGILITLEKKLVEAKGKLVLCSLRPELARLFEIAKLHKHFKFAADEEAALALFGVTTGG
ncbi:MAG: STAS domain-containing protein [Planctomycetes bacterium]|nr:STAS domain-containing protein [Planctomycetota bacterium]